MQIYTSKSHLWFTIYLKAQVAMSTLTRQGVLCDEPSDELPTCLGVCLSPEAAGIASMSLFYLSTAELPLCLLLPEFNMSVAAVSSFGLFIYLFIQCWLLLQLRFVNVLHLSQKRSAQSNVWHRSCFSTALFMMQKHPQTLFYLSSSSSFIIIIIIISQMTRVCAGVKGRSSRFRFSAQPELYKWVVSHCG